MFEQSKSEIEIRGAYEELKKISNELATSDEPGKIKKVIAAFSSDIKILAPGDEVSFSIDRDLGDHSQDNKDLLKHSSHNFKLEIMSFDIKKLEK